jgi:hypothetical protein
VGINTTVSGIASAPETHKRLSEPAIVQRFIGFTSWGIFHRLVMFLLLVRLGYGLQRGGILTDETTAWLARLVAL